MLKDKRVDVVKTEEVIIKNLDECLKWQDEVFITTKSKVFYCVYIDKTKFTINEIARETHNSESTIRRYLKEINELLKKIKK